MAKKSKKYLEAAKKIDSSKAYSVEEAIALAKETDFAKFDASVEVAYRLGLDPKKADQQLRGAVVLPNGTGKTQRVLVFAKGEKAKIVNNIFYWQIPKGQTLLSDFGKVLGKKSLKDKLTSRNANTFEKIINKFNK